MISEHSAYAYCIEDISLIENYEEAKNSPIQWQCHHRLEIILNKSANELIKMGLYYHRPASELIFLTVSEHSKLHQSIKTNINNGPHLTEEHKRKIGDANRGRKHSEETKHIISEKVKQKQIKYWLGKKFSDEHRMHLSLANIGRKQPDEIRQKISNSMKGKAKHNIGRHRVYDNPEHTKWHME